MGGYIRDALLAHIQLGKIQRPLEYQQGIGSGDVSALIDVAIRLAGLLSAGKRRQADDDKGQKREAGERSAGGTLSKGEGQESPVSLNRHP